MLWENKKRHQQSRRVFNVLFFLTDFILFYGPLNLRGHGAFEIVDIEEQEAVFKLAFKKPVSCVHWDQTNLKWQKHLITNYVQTKQWTCLMIFENFFLARC